MSTATRTTTTANTADANSNTNDKPIIRRRAVPSRRTRQGLIRFAKDHTSQNGEDGIIEHLFQLIPPTTKWCLDIGAWDGRHLSNTFSLLVPLSTQNASSNSHSSTEQFKEQQDGTHNHNEQEQVPWKGILIEADTERFHMLERLHKPLGNKCLNVKVSCLDGSPNGLVPLLKQQQQQPINDKTKEDQRHDDDDDDDNNNNDDNDDVLPMDFDFLCIDVDGSDYWLLHDVWHVGNYHPKVVCVEFNPTMPDDLIYIPSRSDDDTIRHGASLSALVDLAQQYGYTLVETTLYNAFFVRNDLYQEYLMELVPDTSIEALHEITMGTSLYQLYDGTIKLWGCKKLLWHRIPIDETKIQILPPEQRNFPFAPSPNRLAMDRESYQEIYNRAIDMSSYCRRNRTPLHDNDDHLDDITNTTTMSSSSATSQQQQQQACASALITQLKQDGFCCIRGTGLSSKLCQTALSVTHSFLQDADENVRRSCLTKDRARRGYSPMCTENFASLIGETGPNDLVRKFRMGPRSNNIGGSNNDMNNSNVNVASQDSKDSLVAPSNDCTPSTNTNTTKNLDASPLLRPNVWPSPDVWTQDACDEFQSTLEEYYDQACSAAHATVKAICDGLTQSQPELASSIAALTSIQEDKEGSSIEHTSILTLLGYRKGTRHKISKTTKTTTNNKKRIHPLVAAHTDVGVITMLLFDGGDCAALERKESASQDGDLSWAKVLLPPIVSEDPIFIVNIADCLSDLSHGFLPSTLHRVVPDTGSIPRNCLALFVGLDPKKALTLKDGNTMTYEEWRKRRIAAARSVLKESLEDKR